MSISSRLAAASDADLVQMTRSGDEAAYGELYARHRGVAIGVAHVVAGPAHADDLVAEAFARVFGMLRDGRGPTENFRPYLLTTLRNVHLNNARTSNREDLVADYTDLSEEPVVGDGIDDRLDNDAIGRAFKGLPERWQTVLWMTAVEHRSNDEVALHLGIKPNAVSALSFRAREGLREAYLADHLAGVDEPDCAKVVELIPAYLRGSITPRRRQMVEEHLDSCRRCFAAVAELETVNTNLAALLAPVILGVLAAKTSWGANWLKSAGAFKPAAAVLPGGQAGFWGLGAVKAASIAAAVLTAVGVGVAHTDLGNRDHDRMIATADMQRTAPSLSRVVPSLSTTASDEADEVDAEEPIPSADASTDATREPARATGSPAEEPTPRTTEHVSPDPTPHESLPVPPVVATPKPSLPTTASTPTAPPAPPAPQTSIGAISWRTFLGLSQVVVPVDNATAGTTVTVTTSRVVSSGAGYLGGSGWSCGRPTMTWPDGSPWATSRITCTYSGTGTGDLRLVYGLFSATAPMTVEVAPGGSVGKQSLVKSVTLT